MENEGLKEDNNCNTEGNCRICYGNNNYEITQVGQYILKINVAMF